MSNTAEILSERAEKIGCKLALYNHGDWFGQPPNQVKIIQALPNKDLGIIYNFHHAHDQLADFGKNVELMMPYLWHVNVSGLKKEGPKILPVGTGDYEMGMIELLLKEGYTGDFGVLGHVHEADVEMILKANLSGLLNY